MKDEYWKVILFSKDHIYAGSERFASKWQAEQYIKEQKGRIVEHYAKLEHWERRSEEIIEIEPKR